MTAAAMSDAGRRTGERVDWRGIWSPVASECCLVGALKGCFA
jgi:hypothetical protein